MTPLSHVDETLAAATLDISRRLMPKGYEVCDPSPSTLEECTAYFREHGTIGVDPAFGNTSIFADANTHRAFNAWHDYCHVVGQCTFDMDGERRVDDIMQEHLGRWWTGSRHPVTKAAFERASTALKFFNLGRLEYWLAYGEAPPNPRQFLVGYLTALHRIAIPERCAQAGANEWTYYL